MSNPVAYENIVHKYMPDDSDHPIYKEIVVWCPGCEQKHQLIVEVMDKEFNRPNGTPYPVWGFDGNMASPTFDPSLLCYSTIHICKDDHPPEPCEDYDNCEINGHQILNWDLVRYDDTVKEIYGHSTDHTLENPWGNCHSFIRSGVWDFLGDSAHALAGQKVPMVPIPDKAMPKL